MRYAEVIYNRWGPHTHNNGLPPATAIANSETQNQQLLADARPKNKLSNVRGP